MTFARRQYVVTINAGARRNEIWRHDMASAGERAARRWYRRWAHSLVDPIGRRGNPRPCAVCAHRRARESLQPSPPTFTPFARVSIFLPLSLLSSLSVLHSSPIFRFLFPSTYNVVVLITRAHDAPTCAHSRTHRIQILRWRPVYTYTMTSVFAIFPRYHSPFPPSVTPKLVTACSLHAFALYIDVISVISASIRFVKNWSRAKQEYACVSRELELYKFHSRPARERR